MIEIRPLTTLDGFDQCVALEEAIWGYDPADMIPRRMFLLASRIGGQVLGAFESRQPVGFAMALPAYRERMPYLHSHMVGVLPTHRNLGIARSLKLAQRADALARGIELMEWTFDPLEIKNAHLNIAKLGAIVRRYQHDFYGPSSSPLQGGLPTDRVYAEWWLRSAHVEAALRDEQGDESQQADSAAVTVDVPGEIYAWKASANDRGRALDVQTRNAAALEQAFARGLAATSYRRNADSSGTFVLSSYPQP